MNKNYWMEKVSELTLTNVALIQKNNHLKAKIAELETIVDDLQAYKDLAIELANRKGYDSLAQFFESADAYLISTAPEMYKMLELAISYMDGDSVEDFVYHYKEIEHLLAKARGELRRKYRRLGNTFIPVEVL